MCERRISKLKNGHALGLHPLMLVVVISLVTTAAAFALLLTSEQSSQAEERKVELIRIRSTGISPAEITRAAGACVFTIDNESGVQEITLYLDRANGERVREIAIPKGVPNWGAEVDLPAGNYILKEAAHPEWTCHITAQ